MIRYDFFNAFHHISETMWHLWFPGDLVPGFIFYTEISVFVDYITIMYKPLLYTSTKHIKSPGILRMCGANEEQ
jgi:hypothetical protein